MGHILGHAPWTVTFPILLGGIAYWLVEHRSIVRGDSEPERQEVIHRGLLYSSGLVAGEAIMGILIAVWVLAGLPTPILKSWSQQGGFLLEIVSLVGLLAIVVALIVKCLRRRD